MEQAREGRADQIGMEKKGGKEEETSRKGQAAVNGQNTSSLYVSGTQAVSTVNRPQLADAYRRVRIPFSSEFESEGGKFVRSGMHTEKQVGTRRTKGGKSKT